MKIKWNEVTWYSKIVAVILGLSIFWVGFSLGTEYEKTLHSNYAPQPTIDTFANAPLDIIASTTTPLASPADAVINSSDETKNSWPVLLSPEQTDHYLSSELGIAFDYPSTWRVVTVNDSLTLGDGNTTIKIISLKKTDADKALVGKMSYIDPHFAVDKAGNLSLTDASGTECVATQSVNGEVPSYDISGSQMSDPAYSDSVIDTNKDFILNVRVSFIDRIDYDAMHQFFKNIKPILGEAFVAHDCK